MSGGRREQAYHCCGLAAPQRRQRMPCLAIGIYNIGGWIRWLADRSDAASLRAGFTDARMVLECACAQGKKSR